MGDAERSSDRRLDSWKEIAAFFGRDERTVRRWEKENSLPVHRVPGGSKARVFAYESELTQWLATPQSVEPESDPNSRGPALVEIPRTPDRQHATRKGHLFAIWGVSLGVSFLLAFGILAYRKGYVAVPNNHRDASAAEEFYLKGRYYWNKRTAEDLNKAVDYFTQAIVQDQNFVPAYVGLADSYNLLREFSVMPEKEAFSRARAAAQKAVDLDPASADAHSSLAFALFWGYLDVAEAERHFQTALRLQPNNARSHHWYATFLAELGREREALAQIELARQLDPTSTPILADKGSILDGAGERQQAVGLLKQVEIAEPAFVSPHRYLAEAYFFSGQYQLYFDEAQAAAHLQGAAKTESELAQMRKAYLEGGVPAMLKTRLQLDEDSYSRGESTDFDLAVDYALLNNKPQAMTYLQSATQKHDPGLSTLLVNRYFVSLRNEDEYKKLVKKVGLPEAN